MDKHHCNKKFNELEKDVFYNVVFSRRDVRKRFTNKSIEDKTIYSILKAAHHAPSVGYSQPWNFILIKDKSTRLKVKDSFLRERLKSVDLLKEDRERQERFKVRTISFALLFLYLNTRGRCPVGRFYWF